jgi:YesN/AraC family two-component response regulator
MKKILVIEDEACTRNLLLSSLEAEGYATTGAVDGFSGIQKAQNQLPNLVICDILTPRLDGYSVLSTLRQNSKTAAIPFIFLTASLNKAELPPQIERSQDSYLAKPVTIDELLEAIAFQLEKQAPKLCQMEQKSPASFANNPVGAPVLRSIFPCIGQLNEVFEFIEENYHRPINLNDVAQAVGYSPAYLTTLVGSRTGLTVSRWITERRIVEVRSLLQHSDYSIEQIASTVGYTNVRHLFRQFRQYHHMTPQLWRKKHRPDAC